MSGYVSGDHAVGDFKLGYFRSSGARSPSATWRISAFRINLRGDFLPAFKKKKKKRKKKIRDTSITRL